MESVADIPEIGIAINKAAKNLPEGYRVNIMIENGGYDVELESQKTLDLISICCGDGIVADINDAVMTAIKDSKQ